MFHKLKAFRYLLFIVLASCTGSDKTPTKPSENVEVKKDNVIASSGEDTRVAADWLKSTIISYFEKEDYNMKAICTPAYGEYKDDAINVDMDGGMSEEAFQKKWKDRFNTRYAGIGLAFLVSAQDNGKITVPKCEFINKNPEGGFVFATEIEDKEYKAVYKRDITVTPSGNSFLIADVKEYN